MQGRDVPTQKGLNFQYHIGGSGIRTHRSIVRNNGRNAGLANVSGHAKSSCKQYRLATRAVRKTLTTPKEDEDLLSSPSVESSPPTETVFKEYSTAL